MASLGSSTFEMDCLVPQSNTDLTRTTPDWHMKPQTTHQAKSSAIEDVDENPLTEAGKIEMRTLT